MCAQILIYLAILKTQKRREGKKALLIWHAGNHMKNKQKLKPYFSGGRGKPQHIRISEQE